LPQSITLPTELRRQHELIDAALLVNEAPTLHNALQVLAESGLNLIGADRLSVVVWNEELSGGTLVAGAGRAAAWIGAAIPMEAPSVQAIATGEPQVAPPVVTGLPPALAAAVADVGTALRVPLVTETVRATFHAGWKRELDAAEVDEAASLLHTLTRLTSLAERSLREREQARLDLVLEGVGEGVIFSSPKHIVLNDAARRMLAVPDDVELHSFMASPRLLDGTPIELDPGLIPGQKAIEAGVGGSFRIRATALDGRDLVLDGSVSPVGEAAVIVFRDVTDEHERNQFNEQTLNALFDAIPTAISVADPATRELIKVNRALCELLGRPASEIVGLRPPFPWWGDDDPALAELAFAPGARFERVFRLPDGRPQPVALSIHDVLAEDGERIFTLALIEDTAEERRMQQQLVQSGKLAAIGELAAGVAHEINNPLFAILGLTEFLLKEAEPGSKARQRLELIQQTGLEIKEIVRALLDFARENAEERHVAPLEDIVRSTVDLVRRTNAHKGIELVDSYDGSGALVSASPNQLKQIFLNLIANARQAMPNGGTVSVDVRRVGGLVLATVRDDGPGIEPDVIERVFEPFFTTKRLTGGTGLGLSVSLGIAEAHGGQLTVSSSPGHGSEFTLCLPIAEEEPV
jgi:PAS domain S-box-containing protein